MPADKNTVKRTIREYEMTGGVATHHGGGWKRKLDRKECERVVKKAKKKKSARQIADEYARDTGKTISDRTIRRIIHEGGLAYMKKKKIEKLTPANIKKRLAYAKDMKDFDWNFVLFSDEKTFYLGTEETMCWQDPKNRDEMEVSQYPAKLNVWGAIGYYFKTNLYFFTENLNSELYKKIIEQRLPPYFFNDCPKARRKDWIFMQDGAKAHTAKESIELLDKVAPDRIKNHPPKSPDFNPVEDMWSHLDREIRKVKGIKNIEQLKTQLRKIWNEGPLEVIRASVRSMPKRLEQCVKRRGQRTSY